VVGSPLDVDALRAVVSGHDAVVSTLGQHGRVVLRPSSLMGEFGRTIVEAMSMTDVSRLVVLSAAVLFPARGLLSRVAGWVLRHHARDLRTMEAVVAGSSLAWTIVRPPRLTGGAGDDYVAGTGVRPDGSASISFRAVARCMLDEVERGTNVRQIVGLAS
jgi:putative NADH-flavin reductase